MSIINTYICAISGMLVGILAAIGVDYLFTPEYTLYTGCYTQQTRVEYNQNVQTLTVYLERTGNSSCATISQTLEAHLILRANALPVYHTIIEGFSYMTTSTVVFTGIPNLAVNEVFAQLYLFSFADVVPIEIVIFDEVKSSLGDCYEANSRIALGVSELVLELTPTLLCSAYLRAVTGIGGLVNTLSQVILYLAGSSYELLPKDISDNYLSKDTFKLSVPGDFTGAMQLQRLSAKLFFTAIYDLQSVTFQHYIGSIQITGLNYGDDAFYDTSTAYYIGFWNDEFVVRAQNPLNFAAQSAIIAAVPFTHYVFKLSCTVGQSTLVKSLQRSSSVYNPKEKIYEFVCTDGSEAENQLCTDFYTKAFQESPICTFATVFYNDQQLAFMEQISIPKANSCWDDAVIEVQAKRFCMGVEFLPIGQCKTFMGGKSVVVSHVYLTIIVRNTSLPDFVNEIVGDQDLNQVEFCVGCELVNGIECDAFKDQLLNNPNIAFEVHFEIEGKDKKYELYIFGSKVTRGDYSAVQITVYIIGCGVIVATICMTIYSIIRLTQSLRRKKRLK